MNDSMERNEIKKMLYIKSPIAYLVTIKKGKAYYETEVENYWVNFEIPIDDMGEADFLPKMEAKLLIRWIK